MQIKIGSLFIFPLPWQFKIILLKKYFPPQGQLIHKHSHPNNRGMPLSLNFLSKMKRKILALYLEFCI